MVDKQRICLLAVERLETLDLETDKEFQALVSMASETCETPVALLTLVDQDTQWLRVRTGTDVTDMPRGISFCNYTIQNDNVMVIPDMTSDERFIDNPLVVNEPNVRFYAGAPLITSDGQRIGSICVIDMEAR